jgi:hypothetical protein
VNLGHPGLDMMAVLPVRDGVPVARQVPPGILVITWCVIKLEARLLTPAAGRNHDAKFFFGKVIGHTVTARTVPYALFIYVDPAASLRRERTWGYLMQAIYLSNHPGEKLQAIRRQRQAAEEQEMTRHREAVAQHEARVVAIRRERAEARRQRRWWAWFRLSFSVLFTGRDAPRRPSPPLRPSDQEEILAAGVAGELYVEKQLAPAFGDDWILFRGYKNRRGEIDSVLLGPGGLFALEVKNRNATVHIDGDNWWCDKYDRYGNQVEEGKPFVDKGGRSPSREVNEPADELEKFLRSRGQPVPVQRL